MKTDFEAIMTRFTTNLDSLREYTQVLSPVARQTQLESMVQMLEAFKQPGNSEETRKRNDDIQNAIDSIRQGAADTAAATQAPTQPTMAETTQQTAEDGNAVGENEAVEVKVTPDALRALKAFSKRAQTVSILNRSALMTVISFFELLLADVFRAYYNSYPQALSGNDKIFSVNDIKVFDTVQEILENLANERVDNLLRQSLADWVDFFSRQKIDITAPLKPYWDEIEEIYQRRNIMVHNDGIVNKVYLSKVSTQYLNGLRQPRKLGDKLRVSTTYLMHSLDLFTVLGVTLVDLCWAKFCPTELTKRENNLSAYSYEHVRAGNWPVVEALTRHCLSRGCLDLESQLIYQMNYWLAVKRLGRWEEVEPAVSKFDTKACHPKFALAVFCLRGDLDAVFKVLPAVAGTGDVEASDICEWPVLEELRNDKRFYAKVKECFPAFEVPAAEKQE